MTKPKNASNVQRATKTRMGIVTNVRISLVQLALVLRPSVRDVRIPTARNVPLIQNHQPTVLIYVPHAVMDFTLILKISANNAMKTAIPVRMRIPV